MVKQRVIFFAALGLFVLMAGLVPLTNAQTADECPGTDCIAQWDFNTDLDGWYGAADTSLTWENSKTLGVGSLANGVMAVRRTGGGDSGVAAMSNALRDIFLQPGEYQLRFRVGRDFSVIFDPPVTDIFALCDNCQMSDSYFGSSAFTYLEFYSSILRVDYPGNVQLVLESNLPGAMYYDRVWLVRVAAGQATATPDNYHLTPTPRPGTPIPTEAQATPAPTGTQYCVPVSPTPSGEAPFNLTPQVTPTEDPSAWSVYDDFGSANIYDQSLWSAIGAVGTSWTNHTDKGGQSMSRIMKYQPEVYTSTVLATFTDALTLIDARFATPSFWVDGWAQADVVPAGHTAYLEVWGIDPADGLWHRMDRSAIGAASWYPFHIEITSGVSALAFVASRSDSPVYGSGYVLLDDVSIYQPLAYAPRCDGSFTANTTHLGGGTFPGGPTGIYSKDLTYPGDKPCPGEIMAPNNLWGMLLSQFTFFLDNLMAFAPTHVVGQMRDLAHEFMLGPLGGIFVLATMVLDWRIPLTIIGLYLIFQAGLGLVGIWKLIRRTFIM